MIQNRHQLLLDTIGVRSEEITALQRVCLWQWVSPLLVTLAWIIDCSLIFVFHWLVHPWVDIVREDTKGDMERILQKTREYLETEKCNDSTVDVNIHEETREHLETEAEKLKDSTKDANIDEEQLFEYSLKVRRITHHSPQSIKRR